MKTIIASLLVIVEAAQPQANEEAGPVVYIDWDRVRVVSQVIGIGLGLLFIAFHILNRFS